MYDTLIKKSINREELDFYATERRAIEELLKVEKFNNIILEPACGAGHIGRVLEEYNYKVKASDIKYRGYGNKKEINFFNIKENDLDIITNPPYFCAKEFLEHALNISKEKTKLAMLFRLAFLESKTRYELFKTNPPKKVYVFSKRINCAKNGEFEKYKSSAIAFAWFIFEKGYKRETILKWIE